MFHKDLKVSSKESFMCKAQSSVAGRICYCGSPPISPTVSSPTASPTASSGGGASPTAPPTACDPSSSEGRYYRVVNDKDILMKGLPGSFSFAIAELEFYSDVSCSSKIEFDYSFANDYKSDRFYCQFDMNYKSGPYRPTSTVPCIRGYGGAKAGGSPGVKATEDGDPKTE